MPPPPIDLRSDTVTLPTQAMRRAMADADVGDDVMEGDPTVRRLEERVAHTLGKQAALFTPSGTMANLLAIVSQTRRGDEIICHDGAHVFHWEAGGYAAVAGCSIRMILGQRGVLEPGAIRQAVRFDDPHCPPTTMLCLENTHNKGGGAVWPIEALDAATAAAVDLGLRVHLDGARLWNAHVATGLPMHRLARDADSVSVCFSKGLGAPVGSALAADAQTIARARRHRKMLGGGLRQAGVLAAGALHAMDHHVARLADDHANARALADLVADAPGFALDPPEVETNILYARVAPDRPRADQARLADAFCRAMLAEGVGVLPEGDGRVRAVCNLGVDADGVARAGEAWLRCTRSLSSPAPNR